MSHPVGVRLPPDLVFQLQPPIMIYNFRDAERPLKNGVRSYNAGLRAQSSTIFLSPFLTNIMNRCHTCAMTDTGYRPSVTWEVSSHSRCTFVSF